MNKTEILEEIKKTKEILSNLEEELEKKEEEYWALKDLSRDQVFDRIACEVRDSSDSEWMPAKLFAYNCQNRKYYLKWEDSPGISYWNECRIIPYSENNPPPIREIN